MGAWLDRLALAPRPALWLDDVAYAEQLLAGGAVPWLDVASLLSWRRKAIALLRPDINALPLAPMAAAWIQAHEPLRREMAAKRRATAPLKTLLASGGLRAHVGETLRALKASSSLPLALLIPSPRRWVADAQRSVFAEAPPADEDATDSASVLIADFLRAFGESGIDVLLLEEDATSSPANAGELGWYRSTINVARHYGWDVGVRSARSIDGAGDVDFVVSPGSAASPEIDPGFWSGGATPQVATGGFRFAAIPVGADPQTVMERLDTLR